jgi:hypothetical protein
VKLRPSPPGCFCLSCLVLPHNLWSTLNARPFAQCSLLSTLTFLAGHWYHCHRSPASSLAVCFSPVTRHESPSGTTTVSTNLNSQLLSAPSACCPVATTIISNQHLPHQCHCQHHPHPSFQGESTRHPDTLHISPDNAAHTSRPHETSL